MNERGFTLVELIVAIGIFTIISMMVVANLRGGSPTRDLQLQAKNLDSLLRQAQVQSLAGEPFGGIVPIGGYGVLIATCAAPPCSVTFYADVDGNFTFDGPAEEIQQISLGAEVTINAISLGDPVHINFKPPRPFTCFNNQCSGVGEVTITLGHLQTPQTHDVLINQVSGLISS